MKYEPALCAGEPGYRYKAKADKPGSRRKAGFRAALAEQPEAELPEDFAESAGQTCKFQ